MQFLMNQMTQASEKQRYKKTPQRIYAIYVLTLIKSFHAFISDSFTAFLPPPVPKLRWRLATLAQDH